MDIKAEELLYKLQQRVPLPEARVLLLCGEEQYYRSGIIKAMPDYVFGDTPAADREINIFEKDTDVSELSAAINTYPFFSGQSLIIIKDEKLWSAKSENAQKALERLQVLLSDVPDYCTVLISAAKLDKRTKLYKQLKKTALVCDCSSLRPYELGPWLDAQAEQYGARFEQEAVGTIMEYLAPVDQAPLQLLQQEIAKLAIYAGERKRWTRQDILDIFAALPEASDFALTNFIMEGRLKEALEALASARKNGTNILPLCGMVSSKLRQVLRYLELRQQGYDQKGLMEELGVRHPYAMKMLAQQSRRFSASKVQQALLAIADLNVQLRQGGRSYAALEEILLQLLR